MFCYVVLNRDNVVINAVQTPDTGVIPVVKEDETILTLPGGIFDFDLIGQIYDAEKGIFTEPAGDLDDGQDN
jgi:hypothetical protein